MPLEDDEFDAILGNIESEDDEFGDPMYIKVWQAPSYEGSLRELPTKQALLLTNEIMGKHGILSIEFKRSRRQYKDEEGDIIRPGVAFITLEPIPGRDKEYERNLNVWYNDLDKLKQELAKIYHDTTSVVAGE